MINSSLKHIFNAIHDTCIISLRQYGLIIIFNNYIYYLVATGKI